MKPEDLYEKIRKEKTEEALSTGKKWIPLANGIPIAQLTADEVKVLIDEVRPMLRKPSDIEMIQIFNVIDGRKLSVAEFISIYPEERKNFLYKTGKVLEEIGVPEAEQKLKVPEGVETVKYSFVTEQDVDIASTMFEAMGAGKAAFKSAVNIGNMVRTVMFSPPTEKYGSPIRVALMEKDMAWHMQQLIDWCLWNNAKVLAMKKEGKDLYIAFRMEAIKAKEPPKEKLWYHFKKTDGWTLVGEPK